MPRLYRPPIPLEVKLRVLLRQRGEMFIEEVVERSKKLRNMSSLVAFHMAGLAKELGLESTRGLRLDHNPALGLRKKRRTGRFVGHGKNRIEVVIYTPRANDPDSLLYRTDHAHHIKTNVRGDGAQFSDTALMKRERRRVKKSKKQRNGSRIPDYAKPQIGPDGRCRAATRSPRAKSYGADHGRAHGDLAR